MNNLVKRLANGRHPITAAQYKDASELKNSIDRKYVILKFIETNGGTELGFNLNDSLTRLDGLDFNEATGTAHLVGELTLDYKQVRIVANIDLGTLKGEGHLELIKLKEQSAGQDSKIKTESGDSIH